MLKLPVTAHCVALRYHVNIISMPRFRNRRVILGLTDRKDFGTMFALAKREVYFGCLANLHRKSEKFSFV